ncbi:OmpP1/FadL family transporter [Phenylobacterium sp.]|uniref:OmpP1/FadL family transporter n=1 Tax=Phenylobacterium sp. TaxID=1871053 RepID=UPI003562B7BC
MSITHRRNDGPPAVAGRAAKPRWRARAAWPSSGRASPAGGLAAAPAGAAGFYIQEQSSLGAGRAYSGEAAETGVASIWWNPAAIARLRHPQAYAGAQAILVEAQVNDAGSTIQRPGQAVAPVGGEPGQFNPLQAGIAPSGAVAYPLGDRVVIGLSVTSPFNFTNKYADASWTRYDAVKSRVTDANVEILGAVRVTERLDLGLGLDAQYASATLTQALPNLSPLLPDARQRLSGGGWDYGWDVGAQYHPDDRLTLAASYRSRISHTLSGDVAVTGLLGPLAAANLATNGKATFDTPWIATLGARWQATDRLWLNAQVQRMGWSEFRAITVSLPGVTQVTPQDYRDTTTIAVGLDYAAAPDWTVRAGVQHDPTPTPDASRSTRLPDGDRWLFGLGASHRLSSGATIDVNADYIAFADSRVNRDDLAFAGTPVATRTALRGTVSGDAVVFGADLRWGF